jgi:hypothetical protein
MRKEEPGDEQPGERIAAVHGGALNRELDA